MRERTIRIAKGPADGQFRAAPSKSVTHRALVAAALARGSSTLLNPLDADDCRITRDGLSSLGIGIRVLEDAWVVEGSAGSFPGGGDLFLGESGTSARFLTAVAALGLSPSGLDGAPRLRERPMQELATALSALGGAVRLSGSGGLPLRAGGQEIRGGHVRLPSGRSSQFASALMLIAARLGQGLDLELEPPVVSLPYVALTVAVLEQFGLEIEQVEELRWRIPPGDLRGREYRIDGDHSSASYFLAAAAVLGGRVRVVGLDPRSKQPDARLGRILQQAGCSVSNGSDWIEVASTGDLASLNLEMGDAPDLVPTLAVLALFAEGPSTLRGIAHLRHKESDRLEVLARNLRELGRDAHAGADQLQVAPRSGALRGALIRTDSDHRMAMAFGLAGLRQPGIRIDDADCVAKSNPRFWDEFERFEGR
jgi:3-phosphoshikimate 1-carboxyvinyltransferase